MKLDATEHFSLKYSTITAVRANTTLLSSEKLKRKLLHKNRNKKHVYHSCRMEQTLRSIMLRPFTRNRVANGLAHNQGHMNACGK